MKETELRENADCSKCGKGIGASGVPLFYRVTMTTYALDLGALQRQQGLGMQVSPAIASILGPDEDLATEFATKSITLCVNCAIEVMAIYEQCGEDDGL